VASIAIKPQNRGSALDRGFEVVFLVMVLDRCS
jgi:hypothetical protein